MKKCRALSISSRARIHAFYYQCCSTPFGPSGHASGLFITRANTLVSLRADNVLMMGSSKRTFTRVTSPKAKSRSETSGAPKRYTPERGLRYARQAGERPTYSRPKRPPCQVGLVARQLQDPCGVSVPLHLTIRSQAVLADGHY